MAEGSKGYERFAPGAFDKALTKSDVRAFLQHDHSKLLGRQSSGTLRLEATDAGLSYSLDLPDTTYANDAKVLMQRGDLTEMSFGFVPGKYEIGRLPDGSQVRTHTEAKELVDISPVAIPAFEGTSIQLRSKRFDGESAKSQAIRIRNRRLHNEKESI